MQHIRLCFVYFLPGVSTGLSNGDTVHERSIGGEDRLVQDPFPWEKMSRDVFPPGGIPLFFSFFYCLHSGATEPVRKRKKEGTRN